MQHFVHPKIDEERASFQEICRQFRVARLDVFGSAARGIDFKSDASDIDFLVDFEPPAVDLSRFLGFQDALEALLGRPVDLLDRKTVEGSRNYIRRRLILSGAEPIYAA